MADKRAYYDLYDVEEYYLIDPTVPTLEVWLRQDGRLRQLSHLNGCTSPRLAIRFALESGRLEIYDPQGNPFLTSVELVRRAREESARAEQEAARADREHRRAEGLAAQLRALGIDPEALDS